MKLFSKTASLMLFAVAVMTTAQADFQQLDIREDGRGYVRLDGHRQEISNVRIRLMRDGRFSLTTSVSGHSYFGSWDNAAGNTVRLNLDRGKRYMDGTGTLSVGPNNTIRSLTLQGTRGSDLDLSFRSTDRGNGSDRWERDLHVAQKGDGTFRFKNIRRDLDKATLDLDDDGKFLLRLEGDRDYTFTGKYRRRGNNVELDIDESSTLDGARGTGRVQLSGRRQIGRIDLDGTHEKRRFTVDFRG